MKTSKTTSHLVFAALALSCLTTVSWARSQSVFDEDKGPLVTRTITLAHSHGGDILAALNPLGLGVTLSLAGHRTLLIRGYADEIESAIELIEQLDMPATSSGDALNAEFIPLQHYPPDAMIELVHQIDISGLTSLALDHVNRMLVVQGRKSEIDLIRRIVEEVDKPTKSLTIQFYFIRATIGGRTDDAASQLPPVLEPVVNAMTENWFGNLGLLSTVVVTVDEGRTFDQESLLRSTSEGGERDELSLNVHGNARLQPGNEVVQIEVSASVDGEYENGKEAGDTHYAIETTVAAKVGDFVVLTAGPGSTSQGNAIAMVIRVTSKD